MLKCLLIFLLSFSTSLIAGVIKSDSQFFKSTGKPFRFTWSPERYNKSFTYDVLFYIPESLKEKENVKSLIFMHGGGKSTVTRKGSLNSASIYLVDDLKKLADELQMIVVAPSASGLNWGGHTVGMIRDINHLMRKELSIDHNNIGLAGHSMGGMGIGRSFPFLADEFAYFIPMSSGMDPRHQTEDNLNKVFNVPYVHLQGVKDHFKVFIDRCVEQQNRTADLALQYGESPRFQLLFYNGDHNINYPLFKSTVARLQRTPRSIFQKKLYGTLTHENVFEREKNILYHKSSTSRYFWISVLEARGAPERLDFTAEIKDNIVSIDFKQSPKSIKKVRVHLSKKMLDEEREVELIVNGRRMMSKRLKKNYVIKDALDPAFKFDDFININFN